MSAPAPQREITGKHVLIAFVAFFAVVAAVNVVMMRAAISTFSGVEVRNAYSAGLAFNRQFEAAASQDARHWTVNAHLARRAADVADLTLNLREATGSPPQHVLVAARLAHPADARRDHTVAMSEQAPGLFKGQTDAAPGQWDLVIDVTRDGEELFRSTSRITLR